MKTLNEEQSTDALDMTVYELDLPVRLADILYELGVCTVRDLLLCCPGGVDCCDCRMYGQCLCKIRLLDVRNIGTTSLDQIYEALEKIGLRRTSSHR